MKTLAKFAIPLGLLVCILVASIVFRWMLKAIVPAEIDKSSFGNLLLTLFSVMTGVLAAVSVLGGLSNIRLKKTPMGAGSDFEFQSEQIGKFINCKAQETREHFSVVEHGPLVGVPAVGNLSIEHLSNDPETREGINRLRESERSRRDAN